LEKGALPNFAASRCKFNLQFASRISGISVAAYLSSGYLWDVNDVTNQNFGLLIAYILPGFILLWGLEPYFPIISSWLGLTAAANPSIGGFLYVTMASVALGQIISTFRWLTIDSLHHSTGIRKPTLNFGRLKDSVAAFDRLIDVHYRYYQWHANGLVAISIATVLRWTAKGYSHRELLLLIFVNTLLYIGSRDTLSKYYRRVEELLRRDF